METNLKQNKSQLKVKIPEIEKTLSMVRFLSEKQETGEGSVRTHFSLADALYASADVKPTGKVCLWLGANVMLEYPYDEAEKLLSTNLEGAKWKLVRMLLPQARRAHICAGHGAAPLTAGSAGHRLVRPDVPAGPDHHHRGQHCPLFQLRRRPEAKRQGGPERVGVPRASAPTQWRVGWAQ